MNEHGTGVVFQRFLMIEILLFRVVTLRSLAKFCRQLQVQSHKHVLPSGSKSQACSSFRF